jgi:hypothetical protein
VTLYEPAASADALYVAIPEPFSVPVPRVVVPLRKVTAPVGVGAPDVPVTVAVKVTLDPAAMEVADAVNEVVVDPTTTLTVTALEVDAVFLVSPPYVAVMLCDPTARDEVE